jgi:hypothetical protein
MESDPIIDQIHEIRHRISEECGHDPAALVEHYRRLEQGTYADRLVKSARQTTSPESVSKPFQP